MPVAPTYPGVYIEEIPSGVRTITGVATSITAFVGYTMRGPVNKAVRILNFGDYERAFGGLHRDSEVGYAVRQFFLNGGSGAYVVRVAEGAAKASLTLENGTGGGALSVLIVTAFSEGAWGNYLKLDVDYDTTQRESTFNLTVSEYKPQGTVLVLSRVETHRNLSMDQKSSQYVVNVVNAASQLVQLTRHSAVTPVVLSGLAPGYSQSGDLSALALPAGLDDSKRFLAIIVDGDGPYEVPIFPPGTPPATLAALAASIEAAVQGINPGIPRFGSFSVSEANALGSPGTGYLKLTSGTPGTALREQSSVRVLNASANSAAQTLKLGLANGGREGDAAAALRPSQTGTVSGDLADLTAADYAGLSTTDVVEVTVADGTAALGTGTFTLGSAVNSLSELASRLQTRIRAINPANTALGTITVIPVGTQLRLISGTLATNATVTLVDSGAGTLAADIRLDPAASVNVQKYWVGLGVDRGAQLAPVPGNDGTPPSTGTLLLGALSAKTGMYALEDVDLFNLLCIPRTAEWDDTLALPVISEAVSYCTSRRAFFLVDPPKTRNTVDSIKEWMTTKLTPDKNAALYFPRVIVPDPLDNFRPLAFPPSGTVAGLFARTDGARGVWKAPAGTEATLTNVPALAYALTDGENGILNPVAVNCLRTFPVYGRVCWGARTLEGADQQASEWKYIPVRRLALFIEESLYRGTQWVVFEPNDEPLWAQIRLNVGAFMQNLFRQGAFQGKTPREAYFVKCDKETTTQTDINLGIVNIVVGFAPLKPTEFVIIKIQQMAGQIPT